MVRGMDIGGSAERLQCREVVDINNCNEKSKMLMEKFENDRKTSFVVKRKSRARLLRHEKWESPTLPVVRS
jgi:hypothetical protein